MLLLHRPLLPTCAMAAGQWVTESDTGVTVTSSIIAYLRYGRRTVGHGERYRCYCYIVHYCLPALWPPDSGSRRAIQVLLLLRPLLPTCVMAAGQWVTESDTGVTVTSSIIAYLRYGRRTKRGNGIAGSSYSRTANRCYRYTV